MTRAPASVEASSRTASLAVLIVGAWLLVGWVIWYPHLGYAPVIGIVAACVCLWLGWLQLRAPSRAVWTLLAWSGVLIASAPFAFRFGLADRDAVAYINHIVCGVAVLTAAVCGARQTPAGQL